MLFQEVGMLIRLKIDRIIAADPELTMYKLHVLTGIRPNTISDLVNNRAKHWSVENLERIMNALKLEDVSELMEFVKDDKEAIKN
ncbi:helix-turn-helix domain-containing protein [Paenibacillus larvae]|uniref:HTH cro/C1-type domain-containing protein n=3 Tax=Paenibacillus larvae TaxID=1464 RepID=V9W9K9_9BACL|nr:helix-turn-helix transcriptional regulator [Paenibacillus larvae]AHD06385.1 hypothetical protein ERIC2_c25980 [Paenibacillus larvae subsp. larvae DSM 25430]MDV3484856.1 helix-turn-helix transcriptional regulator [Paenibacillus larvae]